MKTFISSLILVIFSSFILVGQTHSNIEKLPDFMLPTDVYIVKKDTFNRTCFCFNEFNQQIYNENLYNYKSIKYCKVFVKKYKRINKGFWNYELFIKKDTVSKIIAEYYKSDNADNWVLKKYDKNIVVSEHKIKITDTIVATSRIYTEKPFGENSESSILRQYMKTEIID